MTQSALYLSLTQYFMSLGFLLVFLATELGLAWVLALQVFDFAWLPAWWIVPAGAFAGALLAWLAGWWSLRELLRQPVVQTLRAMTAE